MFFSTELQFVAPAVANRLSNTVVLPDGTTRTIAIPGQPLDFTVSPLLEVGWRLPDHTGQFSFGYRFLTTQGTSSETVGGVETGFRSRFDFNELNFDYGTAPWEFEPHWFLQARIGARVSWTYYDTRRRRTSSASGMPRPTTSSAPAHTSAWIWNGRLHTASACSLDSTPPC